MEKLSPRERIRAAARRLFNAGGPHVGVDQIIAESGVAKRTFYHHFPSKTALLAEFFRERDEVWIARLERHASAPGKSPLERVLGLFDGLKEWFAEPDFFGCCFIRGLSDFGPEGAADPVLAGCVREHFQRTEKLVVGLLKPLRPKDYKAFVPRIASLMVGATVMAHATGDVRVADVNKEMARIILAD
ncbi:MAG: TetR/AcrR family transcriptional regulator [Verrucomicrobium sp.]|nr:TetR/AcrR family transcriptional regulator [Verrucomicrobium sp.]